MKKLIVVFVFCAILCDAPLISLAYGKIDITKKIYRHESDSDGLYQFYSKTESSGCRTIIRLREDSTYVELWYGLNCNCSNEIRESTNEIANSLLEIIRFFDLEKDIKTKQTLSINIGCIIPNLSLIKYVNKDKKWPDNLYKHFKKKSSDDSESYLLYVEYLRRVIDESKIYDPFISAMGKVGCTIILKKKFVDTIFFGQHQLTKEELIKRGVFKKGEANKEIYPRLKGGIEFNISKSRGK